MMGAMVLVLGCQIPDKYLLHSKRPLLMGREVLAAVVAGWKDPRPARANRRNDPEAGGGVTRDGSTADEIPSLLERAGYFRDTATP